MQGNVKPPSAVQIPLSWQAKGLLCHLREHPEMKINIADLIRVTKGAARETGRSGVYSIINEGGFKLEVQHLPPIKVRRCRHLVRLTSSFNLKIASPLPA